MLIQNSYAALGDDSVEQDAFIHSLSKQKSDKLLRGLKKAEQNRIAIAKMAKVIADRLLNSESFRIQMSLSLAEEFLFQPAKAEARGKCTL